MEMTSITVDDLKIDYYRYSYIFSGAPIAIQILSNVGQYSLVFDVYVGTIGVGSKYTREIYTQDNKTVFDISVALQSLFNRESFGILESASVFMRSTPITVGYTLNGVYKTYELPITAVYGSLMPNQIDVVRRNYPERIIMFKGYRNYLYYDLLGSEYESYRMFLSIDYKAPNYIGTVSNTKSFIDLGNYISRAYRNVYLTLLPPSQDESIFDNTFNKPFRIKPDGTIEYFIDVYTCRGVYLKWIDQIGNIKEFVFKQIRRTDTTTSSSDTIEYTQYEYGYQALFHKGVNPPISRERTTDLLLGTGNIPSGSYAYIESLFSSNYVIMGEYLNNQWNFTEVRVREGSIQKSNKAYIQSTFSIRVPNNAIQSA